MKDPIKPGEDSRKNWPHVNELKTQLTQALGEIRRLSDRVTELQLREKKRDKGGGTSDTCARWS